MRVIVMRCLIESCRKVFSVEKDEETDHENFNCPICNDGYYVTKFGEGSIVFDPKPQAPETTASPSETAADKGILTEEELKIIENYLGQKWMSDEIPYDVHLAVINLTSSHRHLLSANAELKAENFDLKASVILNVRENKRLREELK